MSDGETGSFELIQQLEPLLSKWMPFQRWFSSGETTPSSVHIAESEFLFGDASVLAHGEPALLWTLVRIDNSSTYQVPLGICERSVVGSLLFGQDALVLGPVEYDGAEYLVYDGLTDPALSRPLFEKVTKGELTAKAVRAMGAEQSNTSLVFDSRYVLKMFRRLHEGNNPDLEVTKKLTEVEFPNIAPVLASWHHDGYDLAMVQPYLWDGTEGGKLAVGSARDFFGPDTQGSTTTVGAPSVRIDVSDPAEAGGDFANEACRLGKVTAELHLALADTFSSGAFDVNVLIASLRSSADELPANYQSRLDALIEELSRVDVDAAGKAIRVHGDYHLGQVLRSVNGWFIFDFEGEPARPINERAVPSSPLKDVAGMLRSFQYAAATAVREQMQNEQESLMESAEAWEQRNRDAFRDGYLSVHDIESILPETDEVQRVILRGFEVEKAIYELAYERAHRPAWVDIPKAALDKLLG